MDCSDEIQRLEVLKDPIQLDLRLNDLRIIVNCLRAVAYHAERDGEAYLDPDGLALKAKLEETYCKVIEESLDSRGDSAPLPVASRS
jgi:hypothetical protein